MLNFVFFTLAKYPFDHKSTCEKQFHVFKKHYNRSYTDAASEQTAFDNFCDNYEFIAYYGSNKTNPIKLHISQFADLPSAPGNMVHANVVHQPLSAKQAGTANASFEYGRITNPEDDDINTYGEMGYGKNNSDCSKFNYSNNADQENMQLSHISSYKIPENLPTRADLRKLGLVPKITDQGMCGSCYVHSGRLSLQSVLLKDIPFILKTTNDKFKDLREIVSSITVDSLSLSIEYLMTYTSQNQMENNVLKAKSFNSFCGGGNFVYIINDVASGRVPQAITTTQQAPYISMMLSDSLEDYTKYFDANLKQYSSKPPTTKPNQVINYSPLQVVTYGISQCPSVIIQIRATQTYDKRLCILVKKPNSDEQVLICRWDEKQIKQIKFYLSRGITLSGATNTDGADKPTAKLYNLYSGGVLDGACTKSGSNHQINLVGYGKYKGTDVWVFANSWGASWGIQGTYYVKIGSNFLCHEVTANAVLNRYYAFNDIDKDPFEKNEIYIANKGKLYKDIYEFTIKDGVNGLDLEDGSWVDPKVNPFGYVFYLIFGVYGIGLLYFFGVCLCCPPNQLIKPPLYLKFDEQNARSLDWNVNSAIENADDKKKPKKK